MENGTLDPNEVNFPIYKKISDYLLGSCIGEGSFAKVRVGYHRPTKEKVSVIFCLYNVISNTCNAQLFWGVKYLVLLCKSFIFPSYKYTLVLIFVETGVLCWPTLNEYCFTKSSSKYYCK